MSYGLEAMTGVLPTVVVAGAAVKITERLFDGRRPRRVSRPRRRQRTRSRSSTGMGFGNFSNLGSMGVGG